MVQNDYGRVSADFENWRRQQEAAQQAALEQQRIAEEQERAAQAAAAEQQRQAQAQQEAMRQAQEQAQAQMQAAQQIPSLQQAQGIPSQAAQMPGQEQQTPNYAEQARAIGLPWSPDDADYVQQINDYNARVNNLKQTAAERQATTDALRQQIAQNPEILEQGKQNLANDKQLNSLAEKLNAFYAKQNNANQDEAQRAYTTAVLRTQIAQNPELFANAVKQFAPKATGRKKKEAAKEKVREEIRKGTPYEPSYLTEEKTPITSLGDAGDFGRMDRRLLEEYINSLGKKKQ